VDFIQIASCHLISNAGDKIKPLTQALNIGSGDSPMIPTSVSVSGSETQHGDTWSYHSIVQLQMGESIFPMEKRSADPDTGTEVIPFADADSAIEALASETARTVLKLL